MMAVRVDSGSTFPVEIDPALVSDRKNIKPPAWAPCLAVMDDFATGGYLLVGWYHKLPGPR